MTQPTVTVYSKPICPQCNATYRKLEKEGIEYTVIDMTTDAESFALVKDELGYAQAPVVIVQHDDDTVTHWSGFQPARIENINTTKENS